MRFPLNVTNRSLTSSPSLSPRPNVLTSPPVLLSLAIGSPLSALPLLVSKITAINGKHGPFDASVIVGDLFKEGSDGNEVKGLKCEWWFAEPSGNAINDFELTL